MSINTIAATVTGKPGEPLSAEARKLVEARVRKMLEEQGATPEGASGAMDRLAALFEESGTSLEEMSAASIASSLNAMADGLDGVANGIVALGFSLHRQGKGRQSFEMGEASGILTAIRALMSSIGERVTHAIKCDCNNVGNHEHPEAEAETIPPPPPAPEPAA